MEKQRLKDWKVVLVINFKSRSWGSVKPANEIRKIIKRRSLIYSDPDITANISDKITNEKALNKSTMCIFLSLGFVCCGQEYVNSSTTLCCVANDGHPTMHPAGNATVRLQCCGSKVIRQEEKCCNGIGYDPQRHVCADRPTPGLSMQVCTRHSSTYDIYFT